METVSEFKCPLCCLKTFSSHILLLCFLPAGVGFMNTTHRKPVEMSLTVNMYNQQMF